MKKNAFEKGTLLLPRHSSSIIPHVIVDYEYMPNKETYMYATMIPLVIKTTRLAPNEFKINFADEDDIMQGTLQYGDSDVVERWGIYEQDYNEWKSFIRESLLKYAQSQDLETKRLK